MGAPARYTAWPLQEKDAEIAASGLCSLRRQDSANWEATELPFTQWLPPQNLRNRRLTLGSVPVSHNGRVALIIS